MQNAIELIEDGGVTTPRGFLAGAVHVGVRTDWDKLDVALLYSERQCAAAAMFTQNKLQAAPVVISRRHLSSGRARAVVVNAGCANAATGEKGLDDAVRMAQLAGAKLGVDPHEVAVASTGVIGTLLPMDRIAEGIERIELSAGGGLDFATAIMTTDTRPKHAAATAGVGWSIGGAVKGVGMIHPNMATMLCFLTTDAPVAQPFLQSALKAAVDASFNMVDVDSDTSTNDMAIIMANGLAGGESIDASHPQSSLFSATLTAVCISLARAMVEDAEGGSKVIEARVEGAASQEDARRAAREIVRSLGVKTAVYGHDPNWGRVLAAVGNSGAHMQLERMALYLRSPDGGEVCLFRDGAPQVYDRAQAKACLAPRDVCFRLEMGLGKGSATAWGSDLTEDYVRLNSLYTT
jgi:glutamate N-acetyltransferase/amino-acid N-acetyltransferase